MDYNIYYLTMSSFLEKNTDFVLKLKIQTVDGQTQVRRVCLPRIARGDGNISYDELIGLVIVFTHPDEHPSKTNAENYAVSLTYYDDDQDLITVTSTEELNDAIELFAGQKFLRMTTWVKPRFSASSTTNTEAGDSSQNAGTPSSIPETSSRDDHHPVPPPIRVVLESFAGILSNAVNNLQEGLATHTPPRQKNSHQSHSSTDSGSNPTETTPTSSNSSKKKTPPKSKPSRTMRGHQVKVPKPKRTEVSKKPAYCEGARSPPRRSFLDRKVGGIQSNRNASSTKTANGSASSRPFIHGRHTCDGCLTTPIVGKRYTATNLADYDLCQHCFDNYKGNEIKYEVVELSRDQALQPRWHRRYQKAVSEMRTRNAQRSSKASGAGDDTNHRSGVASNLNQDEPLSPPNSQPLSFDSVNQDRDGIQRDQPTQRSNSHSTAFDALLKEAIRRSLNDIAPKGDKATKNNEDESTETASSAEKCAVVAEQPSTKGDNEAKDDIPRSVEIIEKETTSADNASCDGDSTLDDLDVQNQLKIAKAMEQAMDAASVDSEKLISEFNERLDVLSPIDKTPSKNDYDTPSSNRKISKNLLNESFASDAVGNGDVAEVMGKTLDMVAGVISEMLSETVESEVIIIGNTDAEENDEEIDDGREKGELVVESNTETSEKPDDDEDDPDWSVVQSVGSNGTTESKRIGKATEMLGSALFNSDMKASIEEKVSNLVGSSSSFSLPSSVPTDLGTVGSRVGRSSETTRWGSELEKLKELGFDNEEKCIEILERLGSTNIGRVVNELLELDDE